MKALDFKFYIGCPCYIFDTDNPVPSTIEGIDQVLDMVISERVNYSPGLIKPVLRRFENISRHEVEELNKLWPKEKIIRTTLESIQLDADIINYLTSINVDVFGWIDKGLAIDAGNNSICVSKNTQIGRNSEKDEVKKFCQQNNIEYSWDWNHKHGVWHEILFDGKLLMQISKGITLEQFKNVISILSNNFYATDFPDDGIIFTIGMKQDKEHEELFAKFMERHKNVFKAWSR